MRCRRWCVAPRGAGFLPVMLAFLGLACGLAGCATSSAEPTSQSTPLAQPARDAVEDDGLPPQVSPPLRIRQAPDDPSEPYSRNYGPPQPAQAPVRLSDAEADAIMNRAIAAHEMRRP